MSLKLYEIAAATREALDTGIDPETGELLPALVEALNLMRHKSTAVAAYALNLEAEARAVKEVQDRLAKRRKALEGAAASLRHYLATQMAVADVHRIEADDHSFTVRLDRERDESVVVPDGVELPDDLCRIKVTREPDKARIKAAILAGEPVPQGVCIVRKDRLTIS